jgi:BCD family chlorophyll transporter-like MFS transporter
MRAEANSFGWVRIVRLGLVQSALGAIVVIATSTLNRVMVVEYALPAALPGALVALHYGVQFLRPRLGHGADASGMLTRWIAGGMAVLAGGGLLAALATALMATQALAGGALAMLAYALIGLGVGAAGTSLLVLMSRVVPADRRAGAATVMWIMMIAGFAITSVTASHFLDPFTPGRLIAVTAAVVATALCTALAAVAGLGTCGAIEPPRAPQTRSFRISLASVWTEPATRRFTVFVFVSMMAYSAEELLLEPFAGLVMHLTVGGSTRLSGTLHAGSALGMIAVALLGSRLMRGRGPSLRTFTIVGCVASAALLALLGTMATRPGWPLAGTVSALGFANGVFAVAAIGSMMELGAARADDRSGLRMGLWGAAQAVAFAAGGILATLLVDVVRQLLGQPVGAYASVFLCEAALFLTAAWIAARLESRSDPAHGAARVDAAASLATLEPQ